MSYRYTTTAWAIAADLSARRSRRRRERRRRRYLVTTTAGAVLVLVGLGVLIGLAVT